MSPRSARKPDAFELDIAEAKVTEVYADPLPVDGDGEFEDPEDEDYMTMIEQNMKERGEPI